MVCKDKAIESTSLNIAQVGIVCNAGKYVVILAFQWSSHYSSDKGRSKVELTEHAVLLLVFSL